MTNKVLYFPYIRVPDSAWFTRMLLYWDQVGSIVPYDYIAHPEKLGEHMRSLVEHELVLQIIPGKWVCEIPRFKDTFIKYIQSSKSSLDVRRRHFRDNKTCNIHLEKMRGLDQDLIRLGLARQNCHPWFAVEEETGNDFMCYLAARLGQLSEVESLPVTDSQRYLSRFRRAGVSINDVEAQLERVRLEMLQDIFPTPRKPLSADEIRSFKDKHGSKLAEFRRRVERELIVLVGIREPALRERQKELFREEVEEQKVEILRRMEENKFGEIIFGKLFGIFGAIGSKCFGLLNTLYSTFGSPDTTTGTWPLAYAAHAQIELLAQKGY